jgi:sugar phosphate isomerase/epimerase
MYVCLNRVTTGGGMPQEQFVQLAADAGFAGADVDLGYAEKHGNAALRDLFAGKKMKFGGWGLPFDWRGDIAKLNEGLARLAAQARIARELKIDSCATWLLPSSDMAFTENWRFHVDRLKQVAATLAEHGLRLGLEYVAPYHLRRRWKHEFIFTAGQMLELAADIGPNVGLLVDCFHAHSAGDTWDHLAKIPADKIVLVHLNDAPNLPLPQIEDGKRLLPGEGVIDLKGFISALKTAGYQGPVSLEVFSAELKAMQPTDAAKKSWEAIKRALAGTGVV